MGQARPRGHLTLAESMRGSDEPAQGPYKREIPEDPRQGHGNESCEPEDRQIPAHLGIRFVEDPLFRYTDEHVEIGRQILSQAQLPEGIYPVYAVLGCP